MFCFIYYFFFNNTATTEIYTLSLHDALPISAAEKQGLVHRDLKPANLMLINPDDPKVMGSDHARVVRRSEEHTSELQSPDHLVCRLLLEKKKKNKKITNNNMTSTKKKCTIIK